MRYPVTELTECPGKLERQRALRALLKFARSVARSELALSLEYQALQAPTDEARPLARACQRAA